MQSNINIPVHEEKKQNMLYNYQTKAIYLAQEHALVGIKLLLFRMIVIAKRLDAYLDVVIISAEKDIL